MTNWQSLTKYLRSVPSTVWDFFFENPGPNNSGWHMLISGETDVRDSACRVQQRGHGWASHHNTVGCGLNRQGAISK